MIDSLIKLDASLEDAREYIPIGCYEPAAKGEVPCSCAGRVNLPKAVELVVHGGYDQMTGEKILDLDRKISSFEDFYGAVRDVVDLQIDRTIELINAYEAYYMEIKPVALFSGTMEDCVNAGMDVYRGGARYRNTSVCAFGMAQAVDAIAAVKKIVFEEDFVSVEELADTRTFWRSAKGMNIFSR